MQDADEHLFALWRSVLEAWADEGRHATALSYALSTNQLPSLAGLYRKLREDPDKSAKAKAQTEKIIVAATQAMLATKTPRQSGTSFWKMRVPKWSSLVLFFLAWLLIYALTRGT